MKNFKKLLKILSDGKIHSGVELGQKLGMTRAAIWKLMQALKAWGIEIEAKTNRGYCIPHGLELLDAKKITSKLRGTKLPLKIFDELPTTNGYLLERAREGKKDIRLCLAEHQTEGRGRFGRRWVAPFGKNIMLSLLWSFQGNLNQLAGLSLVIAVAVVQVLKKQGVKEGLGLKWPNDVLWQGKKLAGILIELHAESHHLCEIVIGIGVNMELPSVFKTKIDKPVIDLQKIIEKKISRNGLIAELINAVVEALEAFQAQGAKNFLREWARWDVAVDKRVQLLLGEKKIEGICRGIDSTSGDLLIEDLAGMVHRYSSGEVSLRLGGGVSG